MRASADTSMPVILRSGTQVTASRHIIVPATARAIPPPGSIQPLPPGSVQSLQPGRASVLLGGTASSPPLLPKVVAHKRSQSFTPASSRRMEPADGVGLETLALRSDDVFRAPTVHSMLGTEFVLEKPAKSSLHSPATTSTTVSSAAVMDLRESLKMHVDLMSQIRQSRQQTDHDSIDVAISRPDYPPIITDLCRQTLTSTSSSGNETALAETSNLQCENAEFSRKLNHQEVLIGKLTSEVEEMRNTLNNKKVVSSDPMHQTLLDVTQQNLDTTQHSLGLRHQLLDVSANMQKGQNQLQKLQGDLLGLNLLKEELLNKQRQEEQNIEKLSAECLWLQNQLSEDLALSEYQQCTTSRQMSRSFPAPSALEVTSCATRPVGALTSITQKSSQDTAPIPATFSPTVCGANITLSKDCRVATRTRGSRDSVVIGSAPLQKHGIGWYYEVEICETVSGWVGGLGIGVTCTPPEQIRRAPDKAWRVPQTYIVGYWGCVFLEGTERRIKWCDDLLKAGSRIGLLISGDGNGDIRIFRDNKSEVFVEGAVPKHIAARTTAYYPIVDVFASTLSVKLNSNISPPPLPWHIDPTLLGVPGPTPSLASVMRADKNNASC